MEAHESEQLAFEQPFLIAVRAESFWSVFHVHRRTDAEALHISPQEAPLLRLVVRGEFLVRGSSNRDLRTFLVPHADTDPVRRRHASARVTRHLRLLRAHGLIKKVPRTHLYRVTTKGAAVMTTAIKFRETDIALLAA